MPANTDPPSGEVPVETIKLSMMRKTIARRLTESKQQVPHFYLTVRCNLDPILRLRGEINTRLENDGIKVSVNDMLMKVMAAALKEVPDANVQFAGDQLLRFRRADISMAVALDGGLVTPVVKGVDLLPLTDLSQRTRLLIERAREGGLLPEDYRGGTCSISNLGRVDEFG